MPSRSRAADGPNRGRPRDPSRDQAIRDATLDLLSEGAYHELTVRAIAQRAGVGQATMYRRWATKDELVINALRTVTAVPENRLLAHEDPRHALVELLCSFARSLQGPHGALILNLLGQARTDPELAEVLRSIVTPRLDAAATLLARLPGLDPQRAEAAATMLPATVLFHIVVLSGELSKGEIADLVGSLVDPLV